MKDPFKYDVFLSFAKSDEEFVKPIWQALRSSGLRVFWSGESLKKYIGQSFFTVIQNALTHSRHFALICTSSSIKSNWVREEYETFFSQCYIPSGRERRLILFSGRDFDKSTLPTLLKNIQWCESIKEIVSILDGVNNHALINENSRQKKQLEITGDELKPEKSKRAAIITDSPFNPIVDAEQCSGCEECVEVCPCEVYEMKDGKSISVAPEECIGCESCVEVCDEAAITIEKNT